MYKRVLIHGASGSGKSYLAKQLSKSTSLPYYELDDIFWKERFVTVRAPFERDDILNRINMQEEWIIEGVFIDWIEPILKRTDIVIILNPPTYILLYRNLLRLIRFEIVGGLNQFIKIINEVVEYKKSNMKAIVETLVLNKKQFRIINSKRQIKNLFHELNI